MSDAIQSDSVISLKEKMFASRLLFDFLDLEAPIRCIDAGALSIGGEQDPWLQLIENGCVEVSGFEPVIEECDRKHCSALSKSYLSMFLLHLGVK